MRIIALECPDNRYDNAPILTISTLMFSRVCSALLAWAAFSSWVTFIACASGWTQEEDGTVPTES